MNTISTNKEKDPPLIRFVNLDTENDEAVINFLRSIGVNDLFLIISPKETMNISPFKLRQPTITEVREWYQKFMPIFLGYVNEKKLSEEDVEWLNSCIPQIKKKLISLSFEKEEESKPEHTFIVARTVEDNSITLIECIVDHFVSLVIGGDLEIAQCAAPDCSNFFIPSHHTHNQKYCSNTCYQRIYSRKRRSAKKTIETI